MEFTSINLFSRWYDHYDCLNKVYEFPSLKFSGRKKYLILKKLIKKYDLSQESIKFIILETPLISDLPIKEVKWIKQLGSYSFGINQTPDGQ